MNGRRCAVGWAVLALVPIVVSVVVDGMEPLDESEQGVWCLVAGDGESLPYHAVVNAQGRFTQGAVADDPLSQEMAALGLDGVIDAIRAIH